MNRRLFLRLLAVLPFLRPMINVRDYGALGDGHHDDTTALQQALRASTSFGLPLYFPEGKYPHHAIGPC